MISNELKKALSPIVSILQGLEIQYYIGGSVASSVFGLPRSTMDVDIVANLKKAHVKDLVGLLQNEYYIDEDVVFSAIERKASFNIVHYGTMMKIDVFILKDRPFDRIAFNRKKTDILETEEGSETFFFCSAEDVIINKLEWFKMGGEVSERQWNDILGVLNVQWEFLDMEYLKHWANEINVTALLDKALNEVKGARRRGM